MGMLNTGQQLNGMGNDVCIGNSSMRSYNNSRAFSRNSHFRDMSTDPKVRDGATNPWKKDGCM